MARTATDLYKITLPNGNTYDIYDAGARSLIDALGNALKWIGVTSTALTDGATTNPIMINGESKTAVQGDVAQYSGEEFAFDGSAWQSLGKNNFGDFAFVNSGDVTASGTFTPAGTVTLSGGTAQSVVTGIGNATTSNIKEFDDAGSVTAGSAASFTQGSDTFTQGTDEFTATVTDGVLTLGFTQGTDSFTQGSDSFTANVPTAVSLPTSKETAVVTAQGEAQTGSVTVPDTATFSGTEDMPISVTGTAAPHTV